MAFYGRNAEMERLGEMYCSGKFEFAVIYGRRRVGKTTLIREFVKDKKCVFFAANESSAADNLLSFSRCIGGKNTAPIFSDYESALLAIFELAESERLVLVIDEYPYLAQSYRGISSLLQVMIDHRKDRSKLMLILCGSSMSFMENQILGYKSPLYGRRTAQFKMRPFTFFEALPFFAGFGVVDKAVLYGITGGIPEYLCKINPQKNIRKNIIDMFLTPSGHFFEEPSNLIKQELREPSTYNVIIESIAGGAARLNEIAVKSGLESNKCSKYLNSLIALGLVKKEYPFGETTGKRSVYKLEDFMFRFWYRFVFHNVSAINAGLGAAVYDNEIERGLNAYMGYIFEDICLQWLFIQAKRGTLPFFIGNAGRWWGTNSKTRSQEEIDIMATREDSALFAECKWRNSEIGIDVLGELKRKSEMFHCQNVHLFLFAKNAFAKELFDIVQGKTDGAVRLVTLAEMVEQEVS